MIGILLGVLYAFFVAGCLILLGLLIKYLMRAFGFPLDDPRIERVYMAIVLIVLLYLIVAAFVGGVLPRPYYPFRP